jgi:hypothetical protein
MPPKAKHAVAPSDTSGFRIFVRSSYTARYNFAVSNYNDVSKTRKGFMRDAFVLLYRSVVAGVWIVSMTFAVLSMFGYLFFFGTLILSILYIALTLYNAYIYFDNRDLLNSSRLLRAKVAGPDGLDYEWVFVPLNSRSANERLAAVDQLALDNIRKEFAQSNENEIECMVYTTRYADRYPALPKELLIHLFGFFASIAVGIVVLIYLRIL